jgi:hypothetical protein
MIESWHFFYFYVNICRTVIIHVHACMHCTEHVLPHPHFASQNYPLNWQLHQDVIPVLSWLQKRSLCTYAVHFQQWEQLHTDLCHVYMNFEIQLKRRGQKFRTQIVNSLPPPPTTTTSNFLPPTICVLMSSLGVWLWYAHSGIVATGQY